MKNLSASNLSFSYSTHRKSDDTQVLDGISFTVKTTDTIIIMGRSGVGKTTLCRLLAGLQKPTSGYVKLNGADHAEPSTKVTISFQDSPCFPWLNVAQNIEFGIKDMQNSKERVELLLKDLGLYKFRNYHPKSLSGGMRQRLSLARALSVAPDFLILDEPFSALDVITKNKLFKLLRREQRILNHGMVIVLHSVEDAYELASKIIILSDNPAKIAKIISEPSSHTYEKLKKTIEEHM